jgi:hypothetical protein
MSYSSLDRSRPHSRSCFARPLAFVLAPVSAAAVRRLAPPARAAVRRSRRLAPPPAALPRCRHRLSPHCRLRPRHRRHLPPARTHRPLTCARPPPCRRRPPHSRAGRRRTTACRARAAATVLHHLPRTHPCHLRSRRPYAPSRAQAPPALRPRRRHSPLARHRTSEPLRHRVDVTAVSPRLVAICDRDGP